MAGSSAQMAAPKDLNEKKDGELANKAMVQAAAVNSLRPASLSKEETKV